MKSIPLYIALLIILTSSALAESWPQFRGPRGGGIVTGTYQLDGISGVKPSWRVPVNAGFSSFTEADGRAFTLVTRNGQEICVALDVKTGKELWASKPLGPAEYGHSGGNAGTSNNKGGDGPRSTPSVDDGRVYILSSELNLACLDAKSGRQVWRKDLKQLGGRLPKWKNAASPIIEGDLLLVNSGAEAGAMMGIRKSDGAVAWRTGSDEMTHSTPVVGEIHGVRQAIFFTRKGLVSVEPTSGKEIWRHAFNFAVSTAMTPVIEGDIVFCSAGYGVGAAACRVTKQGSNWSVKRLWYERGNTLANHWSSPLVKDGHLYGLFGFKKYGACPLMCVELATGKVKWSKSGFGPGGVVLTGDRLLVLGDEGQLVVVDATPSGYKERARTDHLYGKAWSTPTISNGLILARTTKEAICIKISK